MEISKYVRLDFFGKFTTPREALQLCGKTNTKKTFIIKTFSITLPTSIVNVLLPRTLPSKFVEN